VKVALYTYSTKPRGGVVHTLALAEALKEQGCAVVIYALGQDGTTSFFRPTHVDSKLIPFTKRKDETLEQRIIRYIDRYTEALEAEPLDSFDIHHVQDCISANSLNRLMKKGRIPFFIRTVHHMDDFTTPALVDCQDRSVLSPKGLITVSRFWNRKLEELYGRTSTLIYNGVEDRFFRDKADASVLREQYSLNRDDVVFLTIGGIEPRKNTIGTLRAFSKVKEVIPEAVLLIVGGHTLFDYQYYRTAFFEELDHMPLSVKDSVRLLGTPDNQTVEDLYLTADCYLQPSLKEGWGLAVLESMASGTPVVASDIDVFREFLVHEHNALLVDPHNAAEMARQMIRTVKDPILAQKISDNGKSTARKYTWSAAAAKHKNLYGGFIHRGRTANSG
jgi:glycosyltransferase-like protein